MERQRIYDGAKTINCTLGDNIIIGEDSFLRNCHLEKYVQINRRNILEDVIMGEGTYTGANTVIKHAVIGKYCSISWNISSTGNLHNYSNLTSHPLTHMKSFGFIEEDNALDYDTIIIGNDVWVGANACVMPGVKIGDGAVIGGGAVVTHDVPSYSIVVGNPAKVIKYRFDKETIALLLEARWWDWSRCKIKRNLSLFKTKMTIDNAKIIVDISKEKD